MSKFSLEIIQTLENFNQRPIFGNFHSIPPKRDEDTDILYSEISLIQVGFISERFELNIKACKKFEPFKFNESWVSYGKTRSFFH